MAASMKGTLNMYIFSFLAFYSQVTNNNMFMIYIINFC